MVRTIVILLGIFLGYYTVSYMAFDHFPFAFSSVTKDPYWGFSWHISFILSIFLFIFLYSVNKSPTIKKLLFIFITTLLYLCCLLYLLRVINKFITVFPVTPETLSGLVTLSAYFLLVLAIIIIPSCYLFAKIRQKLNTEHSFVTLEEIPFNKYRFKLGNIGFISDIIFPLFLLYNIVYRNQYLHELPILIIIARFSCFIITIKQSTQIAKSKIISIRVIGFLVLLSCLAAMFSMATGFW